MPPLDRHLLPSLALFAGLAFGAQARDVATDSVNTVAPTAPATEAPKPAQVLREVSVEGAKAKPAKGKASEGYKVDSLSLGALGGIRAQDIPYTVSSTSSEFVENLQAGNPTDALRYDPAVNPEMGSNRTGDYFAIRGFINNGGPRAIDGIRDETSSGSLEDKERIEVLSGASGLLYGIAGPAGIVNFVLKRPTSAPFVQLKAGDYGGEQLYTHVDAGGPIGASLGYRVNALDVTDGCTAVDKERNPRELTSIALDWHPVTWATWSADASYFHRKTSHLQAFFKLGSANAVPDAPDASVNYAAPYAYMESRYENAGTSFSADPAKWISLRATVHVGSSRNEFESIRDVWTDDAGHYKQQMMYYKAPMVTEAVQGNAFLDIKGATGFAEHKLTLGCLADGIRNIDAGTSTYKWGTVFSMSGPGDSADPNVNRSQASYVTGRTLRRSGVVVDQIELGSRFKMLGGLTYAAVHDLGYDNTGARISNYDKGALTPGVAFSYLPVAAVTAYVSFVQSLEEGDVAADDAINAGKVLDPYRSNQLEAGVKTTFGGFAINAALFRIDKANAYQDYVNDSQYVLTESGRQVHTGVELSFSGKVLPSLSLVGGVSYLDAQITKTDDPALQGKSPQAVPEATARLFAEYSLPRVSGLSLNGGVSYTGKEWANDANTISIPSVVTADAGVRYTVFVDGREITARAGVSNLSGENYWTTKGGSMLYLGSPRTFAGSLAVRI